MKDKYKHNYLIPEKFTIGIDKDQVGFPTMKDEDGKWRNVSFFEKHCGFKPFRQRDAYKEIDKDLTQRVQEIDNVPISGFKLVKLNACTYLKTDMFKDIPCAVLKDPRGWDVQVTIDNFMTLLRKNGMSLENGFLNHVEVMYKWPVHSEEVPFILCIADDEAEKLKSATTKLLHSKDNVEWIKPSQFEVGKIYSSTNSKMGNGSKYDSMYMYLGVHTIYSDDCHFRAVMTRNYADLENYVKDRTDITNPERHVFYCLNPKHPVIPLSHGIFHNYPSSAPYYVTATVSKLFDKVEDVDPAKFKLYNDNTKPATLDNIKEDMQRSAYFNRIDFAKSNSLVSLDYQIVEDLYGYLHGYDISISTCMATFPFYPYPDGIFLNRTGWCTYRNFTIEQVGPINDNPGCYFVMEARMADEWNGYSNDHIYKKFNYEASNDERVENENKRKALKQLFDEVKPTVTQYVFCNGNKVPAYQNLMLNRRTKYRDIG